MEWINRRTTPDQIAKLGYFENILIVEDTGTIIFCDSADLSGIQVFGLRPENHIGYSMASLLRNIENESSTILTVLKTGIPICNNR